MNKVTGGQTGRAGGNVVKSAQQWADQAHAMYPGYSGTYPRMQLWQGNQDTTLAYPNYGEEIKQWTALRGVSRTPSATDHPQSSWTRNRYGGTGTQAPVEGITIAGTGHTLPQVGMIAYAIGGGTRTQIRDCHGGPTRRGGSAPTARSPRHSRDSAWSSPRARPRTAPPCGSGPARTPLPSKGTDPEPWRTTMFADRREPHDGEV